MQEIIHNCCVLMIIFDGGRRESVGIPEATLSRPTNVEAISRVIFGGVPTLCRGGDCIELMQTRGTEKSNCLRAVW